MGLGRRGQLRGCGLTFVEQVEQHTADVLAVVTVPHQIADHPGGPGHRHLIDPVHVALIERQGVQHDVGAPGALAPRNDELEVLRLEVAHSVQCGRTGVGDHPLRGRPVLGDHVGCKLQPGHLQLQVLRRRSTGDAVHAVPDGLQRPVADQPTQVPPLNAFVDSLACRDQAPLDLGDRREHPQSIAAHGATIAYLQHLSHRRLRPTAPCSPRTPVLRGRLAEGRCFAQHCPRRLPVPRAGLEGSRRDRPARGRTVRSGEGRRWPPRRISASSGRRLRLSQVADVPTPADSGKARVSPIGA